MKDRNITGPLVIKTIIGFRGCGGTAHDSEGTAFVALGFLDFGDLFR